MTDPFYVIDDVDNPGSDKVVQFERNSDGWMVIPPNTKVKGMSEDDANRFFPNKTIIGKGCTIASEFRFNNEMVVEDSRIGMRANFGNVTLTNCVITSGWANGKLRATNCTFKSNFDVTSHRASVFVDCRFSIITAKSNGVRRGNKRVATFVDCIFNDSNPNASPRFDRCSFYSVSRMLVFTDVILNNCKLSAVPIDLETGKTALNTMVIRGNSFVTDCTIHADITASGASPGLRLFRTVFSNDANQRIELKNGVHLDRTILPTPPIFISPGVSITAVKGDGDTDGMYKIPNIHYLDVRNDDVAKTIGIKVMSKQKQMIYIPLGVDSVRMSNYIEDDETITTVGGVIAREGII